MKCRHAIWLNLRHSYIVTGYLRADLYREDEANEDNANWYVEVLRLGVGWVVGTYL